MKKVIFLNKKQLVKLNHKERQDYLSTQERYNKFQIPLMTGMINHIENAHEFNRAQEIINKNYSKIEKEEKKEAREERITVSEPSSSDLGARLKKLRQMYKDGVLSKVEFEKAKNKLLK
jgi:predicted patatin/cPLA2 family phospholipase